MKIIVKNTDNINNLISILNLLKNLVSVIRIVLYEDHAYLQGLDKSQICLYDIKLFNDWFEHYEVNETNIDTLSIDLNILLNVLTIYEDSYFIVLSFCENSNEKINIEFINENAENTENTKKTAIRFYNKSFELPLIYIETDFLEIPNTLHDIMFLISSKIIHNLISQLSIFGDNLDITCDENNIFLMSSSVEKGTMKSAILFEELDDYDVNVEDIFSVKITENIKIFLSKDNPIKINYKLNENSYANFYLAPKINDNEN